MIALSAFKVGVLVGLPIGGIAAVTIVGVLSTIADAIAQQRQPRRARRNDTFEIAPWLNSFDVEDPDRGPARILEFRRMT